MDSVCGSSSSPILQSPFSFPSLVRKLSSTQEIRHSLGLPFCHNPAYSLHRSLEHTHTHGVSCNASSYSTDLSTSSQVIAGTRPQQSLHSLLTHSPESKVHRKRHCHISRGVDRDLLQNSSHIPTLRHHRPWKMLLTQYGIITKSNPYKYFSGNNCFMLWAEHLTVTSHQMSTGHSFSPYC